jgi:uncharacterized protein (TIGR01777 family)
MTERVAITGASGLIGQALTASLRADGHAVVRIGRGADSDLRWDPASDTIDRAGLDGVTAVIHLAGANVGERWTAAHKRAIVDSRVQGTGCIARAVAAMATKPRVLVSASAIGIYGDRGDEWLDEHATVGDDFLARTGVQWERSADPARAAGIRVVHPRTGVVLTPGGGALAKMLPVFRLGGGAPVGWGKQWMSWLSLHDAVAILRFLISRDDLSGAINVVTAEPVTNATFTKELAAALHRPALLPAVPAFVLRAMFGEMADGTVLASQRVRPGVLAAAGFRFAHPTLRDALNAILANPPRP